jgi:hypothetical protein
MSDMKKTETFTMRINPILKAELKTIPPELEKKMLKKLEHVIAKTCFVHNHYDPKLYGLDEEE